jgi:hypothetical protein
MLQDNRKDLTGFIMTNVYRNFCESMPTWPTEVLWKPVRS